MQNFDLLTPVWLVGGFVGFVVGMFVGALIAAVWLRLAVRILGLPRLSFFGAYKAVFISTLTVAVINFAVGLNVGLLAATQEQDMSNSNMLFLFGPHYQLHSLAFALIVTALVFCRMVPANESGQQLTFAEGFTLASVYSSLALCCMLVLGAIAALITFAVL